MKKFRHEVLNEAMAKYGWIVTGVPGVVTYTVGLMDKFKHPELMIHGLVADQADAIIRSALVKITDDGVKFEHGKRYPDVIRGYDVEVLAVHPANFKDWMGQAGAYHGDEAEAVQILWPDVAGYFPGDTFYDSKKYRQLRFDVRRPEYEAECDAHAGDCECAVCKAEAHG